MKNKWKIIAPIGFIAFALICVFGGQALVSHVNAAQAEERGAQQSQAVEETPEESTRDFSHIANATPMPSSAPEAVPTPGASSAPAGETVTVAEDGAIVITPDFSHQTNSDTKIVTPDAQVTANMGGSGGTKLDLGEDGAYHGDNPATPAPAATPAPTQDTSGGGSGTSGDSGSHKDGEISSDGKYEWWDGFGWVDRSSTDGGISGDYSNQVTGGLSGEKVGSM
ncbi:MAG: hypothetical protein VB096_04875 [Pseudoflavonifractor sp.]|nr:hypothetical protein [Pseudoflavonifractor sp.]